MFFIGVFGIGDEEEIAAQYANQVCPACGRWSRAELTLAYRYFHIFFLPVWKYSRKYALRMDCCGAIYDMDETYGRELSAGGPLDFSRMKRREKAQNICRCCGSRLEEEFTYCPRCGAPRA